MEWWRSCCGSGFSGSRKNRNEITNYTAVGHKKKHPYIVRDSLLLNNSGILLNAVAN